MEEEKREYPRGASLTEASFEYEGTIFEGKVIDLSLGGLFIETRHPPPEGSRLTFRFSLPGSVGEAVIMGEGVVIWQSPFQGMGIRITWISDEDREQVACYLFGG